jgi:Zn ribbon nucleic-acid-binding protein
MILIILVRLLDIERKRGPMKTIKVCPDCETHLYLMWSAFNDNTTDCGSCGSNFEEDELKEVDREELI